MGMQVCASWRAALDGNQTQQSILQVCPALRPADHAREALQALLQDTASHAHLDSSDRGRASVGILGACQAACSHLS